MLPAEAKTLIANIGSLVDQLEQLGEGEAAGAPEKDEDEDEEEEVKASKTVAKSLDKIMELITDLSEEEKAALMAALNVTAAEPEPELELEPGEEEEEVTVSKQEDGSTASDDAEERIEDQTTINEESLDEIEKAVDAAKSLVEAGVLRWASKDKEGMAMRTIAKAVTGLAKVISKQAESIRVMEMKVSAYDEAFGITDEVVKKSLEGIQGGNGKGKTLVNSGAGPVESTQETLKVLKDLLGTGGEKGQEEPGKDSGLQNTKRQEAVRKSLSEAMGQGGIFTGRV